MSSGWQILQYDVSYWRHVLLEDIFYLMVYIIGGHVLLGTCLIGGHFLLDGIYYRRACLAV